MCFGRTKAWKEVYKFFQPTFILSFRINIRIIIIDRNVKILGQILKDIRRAWRAACMKKQRRLASACLLYISKDFVQFFLIVHDQKNSPAPAAIHSWVKPGVYETVPRNAGQVQDSVCHEKQTPPPTHDSARFSLRSIF